MTRMGSIHWACGLLELGVQTSLGNWTQKGCKRQPVNQETVLCLELSEWTLLCLWHHGDNQSNSPYNSSKNICWPTQGHSVCLLLAPYCVCLSPFSNLGRVEELPRIKKLRHSNTVAADDRAIIWGFFFHFLIHFSFDGHVSCCLHIFAIGDYTAINMGMQAAFSYIGFTSVGFIPRIGIAGS